MDSKDKIHLMEKLTDVGVALHDPDFREYLLEWGVSKGAIDLASRALDSINEALLWAERMDTELANWNMEIEKGIENEEV